MAETVIEKTSESSIETKPIGPLVESGLRNLVVLARDPDEMVKAQDGLIIWAKEKLKLEEKEEEEAKTNLDFAKKAHLRSGGWRRQVAICHTRVIYYQKLLAALEEGYCIVPEFPIDIIAVRTDKVSPPSKVIHGSKWSVSVPVVRARSLPVGEGDYVSPETVNEEWETKETNSKGEETTHRTAQALDFQPPDLPIRLVKPTILADLSKALKSKIFDEIGILPASRHARRGDPMIIGRIIRRQGLQTTSLSFLITWWIDTRSL